MIFVEIDEKRPNSISIKADWRFKEVCRSIPGSSWSKNEELWRVPLSWTSCLSLRSTFRDSLEIGPELKKWALSLVETTINPANILRELEDYSGNEDLFPHQRAGVEFLSLTKRAILADEPGLGKTAQAIRSLKKIKNDGHDVFPCLVVCPNSVKKSWEREFTAWWPETKTSIVRGTAVQRKKVLQDKDTEVFIINWESLRSHSRLAPFGSISLVRCKECGGESERVSVNRCETHKGDLNDISFESIIADECHRASNPNAKQTRALWAATGDAKIRFALTGTPIANSVVDLWSILHWISPEDWPSKTKWIDRYVDTMFNAFGGLIVVGIKPTMQEEFYASLNPKMRRMIKSKVLPWLPEVLKDRRDIEMGAKQQKAYLEMKNHMLAELENGEVMSAPNVLTQTIRLLQLSSSYAELVGDKLVLSQPSCKIEGLVTDIKNGDFGDDSVAICAVSRQLIDLLSVELVKLKIEHGLVTGSQNDIERQRSIDDFQSGKTKWILFTAKAGGVGLTLTKARRLVMLQRPWSLVDYKQAIDRVHRIGSEIHDSVIITDYITENTIENRVIQVLHDKSESFEEIVRDREKLISLLKG